MDRRPLIAAVISSTSHRRYGQNHQHKSTDDLAFRTAIDRWITDNGEVLAIIRFAGGAGAKSFEFFTLIMAFANRTNELPPSTSVTVLGTRQLPIRGRVDEDFILHASASIRDGPEWLIVCLEKITMGAASWYHDYEGDSNVDLATGRYLLLR